MRAGCYGFVAVLAGWVWYSLDWSILALIVGIVFLACGIGKPTERRIQGTAQVSVVALAVMLFALAFPFITDIKFERIELALVIASNVALVVALVGAVLAYRSVPKDTWKAARPVDVALDPAQVHGLFGWIARAIALIVLVSPFVAAEYAHQEAFFLFAALLVLPYLVFLVNPVRRKWLAWGQALAVTGAVLFIVPLVLTLSAAFGEKHIARDDRAWIAFLVVFFLCQLALFVLVRSTYTQTVRFGAETARAFLYYFCVMIFMAATLPSIPLGARKSGNESGAAGALRTLNTTSYEYSDQFKAGYPPTLKALGPPASGAPTKDAANLIDSTLASGTRRGYRITYRPEVKDGVVVHYSITARPLEYDETGRRSFYTDDSAVIRATTDDREPTANDPPL